MDCVFAQFFLLFSSLRCLTLSTFCHSTDCNSFNFFDWFFFVFFCKTCDFFRCFGSFSSWHSKVKIKTEKWNNRKKTCFQMYHTYEYVCWWGVNKSNLYICYSTNMRERKKEHANDDVKNNFQCIYQLAFILIERREWRTVRLLLVFPTELCRLAGVFLDWTKDVLVFSSSPEKKTVLQSTAISLW